MAEKSKYAYDYPENRDIGKKLISGDLTFISKATGYSYGYIVMVLVNGVRHNEKIVQFALQLLESREKLLNSQKIPISKFQKSNKKKS